MISSQECLSKLMGWKLKSKVLRLVSNHQTLRQIHILVNYCDQNPHFPVREAIKKSFCFLFSDRKRVFFRGANELILLSNNICNTISDWVYHWEWIPRFPCLKIFCVQGTTKKFGFKIVYHHGAYRQMCVVTLVVMSRYLPSKCLWLLW